MTYNDTLDPMLLEHEDGMDPSAVDPAAAPIPDEDDVEGAPMVDPLDNPLGVPTAPLKPIAPGEEDDGLDDDEEDLSDDTDM